MTGRAHAGCRQCLVFRAPSTSSSYFNKAYVQTWKSISHAHNTSCSPARNPSQIVTETVAMGTREEQSRQTFFASQSRDVEMLERLPCTQPKQRRQGNLREGKKENASFLRYRKSSYALLYFSASVSKNNLTQNTASCHIIFLLCPWILSDPCFNFFFLRFRNKMRKLYIFFWSGEAIHFFH